MDRHQGSVAGCYFMHPRKRPATASRVATTSSGRAPGMVPTGSRRLSQLDEMIISLYAGGMTVGDIEHHLVSTLGVDLSHETISNITEEIADEGNQLTREQERAIRASVLEQALALRHERQDTELAARIAAGWGQDRGDAEPASCEHRPPCRGGVC